jgi:hypothetical protein
MAVKITIDFGELQDEVVRKILKREGFTDRDVYMDERGRIQILEADDNTGEGADDFATDQLIYLVHPEMSGGVCEECMDYANTIWDADDPELPELPIHCNCFCELAPYFPPKHPMKGPGAPVRVAEMGEIMIEKIAKMPAYRQEVILGKRVTKLYRAGILDESDIFDAKNKVRFTDDILKEKGIDPALVDTATARELERRGIRAVKQ